MIFSRWWKREKPIQSEKECNTSEHKEQIVELRHREDDVSRRIDALTTLADMLKGHEQ